MNKLLAALISAGVIFSGTVMAGTQVWTNDGDAQFTTHRSSAEANTSATSLAVCSAA